MVSAIESVTIGVENLDAALAAFRDRLRLTVVRDTHASVGLLAAWRRPVHESARLTELSYDTESSGRLRLAQFESFIPSDATPPLVVGPRAFCLLGGIAGEVDDDASLLPVLLLPKRLATLSVVTHDVRTSERFYRQVLGWRQIDAVPSDADRLFGAESPADGFAGFAAPDAAGIDVVVGVFPSAERLAKPAVPGQLGINFCTCRCDDLDEVLQRLTALGIEPLTRPTHVGLPYGRPGRVMLVRGPADELFELVEPAE